VLGPYKKSSDRSVYLGQWKDGLKHGKGKMIWENGSVYNGFWLNDKACGYGRFIHPDGDVYEGQ